MAPGDEERVRAIAEAVSAHIDVAAERARTWARLWVARPGEGESPVAFLLAWVAADELHVIDLATDPGCRRRGAARALLARAIADARAGRQRVVQLEVRASNLPARRLYESAGFELVGVRRGYYSDSGEDAFEMRLDLTDARHEAPRRSQTA